MNISIIRDTDIIDNFSELEEVITLKDFPVSMGCHYGDLKDDMCIDQVWSKGKKSGVYQLSRLIELDLLYAVQHDAGVVGDIWKQHHKQFAKFIAERIDSAPILEIGGAHGILSVEGQQHNFSNWTIVEPAPTPVEECTAKYIKGFFDAHTPVGKQKVIVHSHVLEHIYNPLKFLSNCHDFLDSDGKLLFSVPNIFEMVRRGYSNAINFEHTIFLTENIIQFLLGKTGFEILDKQYFHEDHSIFYFCKKTIKASDPELILEHDYDEIFCSFWDKFNSDAIDISKKINGVNQPIFLFGAHIFSQILLKSGLSEENITAILDNAESKHGKRLYGTSLEVADPGIVSDYDKPYVILRAGKYNTEIINQLKSINPRCVII